MKLSIQTAPITDRLGYDEGYRLIKASGFDAVDWNIDHAWDSEFRKQVAAGKIPTCIFDKPMEDILAYYKEDLDAMKRHGISIAQAHAPFPPYNSANPDFLEHAINIYKKYIEFCDIVGCPNLVIHGITVRSGDRKLTYPEADRLNDHLYESLIPTLQKANNVTVCMENLFSGGGSSYLVGGHCANPYEAAEIIDRMNEKAGKECFGLCLDTGHLHMVHIPFQKYVPILGKRIKALHIHDNMGSSDDHLAPFTGSIRWADFCDSLRDISYSGALNFETFAQISANRIEAELIPAFVELIATIGKYFIKEIEG